MNENSVVSLKHQFDSKTQLPIKSFRNIRLREERFSTPVTCLISTAQSNRTLHLEVDNGPDFEAIYGKYAVRHFLTIGDVVEEAARGMIEEGTKIGRRYEAEHLAEQLRAVKHFGETSKRISKIPPEIDQTCVFLYTTETFWYKLINSVLGSPHTVTDAHLKTLGPFSYLLKTYLRTNSTANILTVYRGVTLTDEQIQQYIRTNNCFCFTSFTSTSTNRTLAEIYGNTLLIIDLNVINFYRDDNIRFGAYIASLSNFPEEEEFLI